MRKQRSIFLVLGLATLGACGDPVSQSTPAATNPTGISVEGNGAAGGGTGGLAGAQGGSSSATGGPAAGGSAGSGGVSSGGAGSGGSAVLPPPPPTTGMPPDLTPEQFCGMVKVDEGGALVIAGCESNVRAIYSLSREQVDGGAWYSTEYGFEAPCNGRGTYRAEVSDVHYAQNGQADSYAFVIHMQSGHEVGGSLALEYEAARLVLAKGVVQGNQCEFPICGASECGILDTSELNTVRGDGGAGSGAGGVSGNGGASPAPGVGGAPNAGGASGGRAANGGASAGSAGRSTGGVGSGFPPF